MDFTSINIIIVIISSEKHYLKITNVLRIERTNFYISLEKVIWTEKFPTYLFLPQIYLRKFLKVLFSKSQME